MEKTKQGEPIKFTIGLTGMTYESCKDHIDAEVCCGME
jgi:hypothetical protein